MKPCFVSEQLRGGKSPQEKRLWESVENKPWGRSVGAVFRRVTVFLRFSRIFLLRSKECKVSHDILWQCGVHFTEEVQHVRHQITNVKHLDSPNLGKPKHQWKSSTICEASAHRMAGGWRNQSHQQELKCGRLQPGSPKGCMQVTCMQRPRDDILRSSTFQMDLQCLVGTTIITIPSQVQAHGKANSRPVTADLWQGPQGPGMSKLRVELNLPAKWGDAVPVSHPKRPNSVLSLC